METAFIAALIPNCTLLCPSFCGLRFGGGASCIAAALMNDEHAAAVALCERGLPSAAVRHAAVSALCKPVLLSAATERGYVFLCIAFQKGVPPGRDPFAECLLVRCLRPGCCTCEGYNEGGVGCGELTTSTLGGAGGGMSSSFEE